MSRTIPRLIPRTRAPSGDGAPLVERRDPSYDRVQARAGVSTWSLDLRTGELRTNAAARALLGWSEPRSSATAEELMVGVHPDDRALALAHFERLLEHGEEFTIDHRSVLPDGSVGYMRASGCCERDRTGRVLAVHGVSTDVTELRHAALALELERERTRGVLAAMTEGYLLMRAGVIVEANAAACALTGFGDAELVGSSPPYPYWPPEDVAALEAGREQMVAAGGGTGEFALQRKDGARRQVAVVARRLAPVGDEPSLWLVLMRDVTEQRAHESALAAEAAADPLTGVSNSRTFRQELHEAVLQAAGAPLSLALIDVDHFKQVNDTFGHAVGDEVLVAVVERLVDATAGAGVLARVGGEEFALLMPGTTAAQGHRVLQDALLQLASTPIGVVGTVTASAGVAELLDGMTDDALYRLADSLLYEAKARGRDQVR